jgi:hypothetical protein
MSGRRAWDERVNPLLGKRQAPSRLAKLAERGFNRSLGRGLRTWGSKACTRRNSGYAPQVFATLYTLSRKRERVRAYASG